MTDKFPEAFKRFEDKNILPEKMKFDQLIRKFHNWARNKWIGTRKQQKSLAKEGKKEGYIESAIVEEEKYDKKTGKTKTRYRDLTTGTFHDKQQYESGIIGKIITFYRAKETFIRSNGKTAKRGSYITKKEYEERYSNKK